MAYAGKYIIGITGPIGAGKSTVLRLLQERGAEVIDADKVAHEVMAPGGTAYQQVIAAFGREILQTDGQINRQRLARQVFSDPQALRRLEAIVHPAVYENIKARIERTEKPIVAIEAIKLLEAGLSLTLCDEVWVVLIDPKVQQQRLAERGMSPSEVQRRLAAQLSPEEYRRRADVVLDNSDDLEHLRQQVEHAWQKVLAKVRAGCTEPK